MNTSLIRKHPNPKLPQVSSSVTADPSTDANESEVTTAATPLFSSQAIGTAQSACIGQGSADQLAIEQLGNNRAVVA